MNEPLKIYFVGFMSSGKTTWAKKIADLLDMSFVDLDVEIESKTGVSITTLFHDYGEDYFRRKENMMLAEFSQLNEDFVMATGGGTPCFLDNLQLIKSGITVYLKVNPETLLDRLLGQRGNRPLIAHLDDRELEVFIEKTLGYRESYYEQADIVVDEEDLELSDLRDLIFDQLR